MVYIFDDEGFRVANTVEDYEALDLAKVLREYQHANIPLTFHVKPHGIDYEMGHLDETGWRQTGTGFDIESLAGNLHNDVWWQMPNEWRWANRMTMAGTARDGQDDDDTTAAQPVQESKTTTGGGA